MRTSLLLSLSGLIVQAFSLYELTPGTFLIFACIAIPLVTAGMITFVLTVWRVLRERKGL